MESPAGCMESVAKRRHGITRQRVFLLRIDYIHHFVMRHLMANIASLRNAVEQHHFEGSEKHHIAIGDASFDILKILWYNGSRKAVWL